MSTGANCYFTEVEPGKWTYDLQCWPYGEWDEYDTFGPFNSFLVAERHLDDNNANPGGYTTIPLTEEGGHVHEFVKNYFNPKVDHCASCGEDRG